jgi:DNA polymerase I
MLVTRSEFSRVIARLEESCEEWWAFDTETTGLRPWQSSRPFSLIVARADEVYYFNFQRYATKGRTVEEMNEETLGQPHKEALARVFGDKRRRWYAHNAKFDMAMLYQIGIEVLGQVFCTMAQGRVLRGDLFSYSLDALVKRWLPGRAKSDAVKEYILANKLYAIIDDPKKPGKKTKNLFYHLCPLAVMQPYAETDGTITWELGEFIRRGLDEIDAKKPPELPSIWPVSHNEVAVTSAIFHMERVGIRLDIPYARAAMEHDAMLAAEASKRFTELTGLPFSDSGLTFSQAFKQLGIERPSGAVGWDKEVLQRVDHEVARAILIWRKANKKATTYYKNFLDFADENGFVHPNFHQGGTKTGRLSCSDPNLQNLSKEASAEDEEADERYYVRRCFVPRGEDYCLFAPDYDQMEYRFLMDMAGEDSVIDEVLAGLDIHEATGKQMGVPRSKGKTLNFQIIYGGGNQKLADALGITLEQAKALRRQYYAKLRKVENLTKRIMYVAETRGYVCNWLGRRYLLFDRDKSYIMPNRIVQGGCAEICKRAMVQCVGFLEGNRCKSVMPLQVHDELIFDVHRSELDICPELVRIMSTAFQSRRLPITCSPAYSWRSLQDKQEGYPK